MKFEKMIAENKSMINDFTYLVTPEAIEESSNFLIESIKSKLMLLQKIDK